MARRARGKGGKREGWEGGAARNTRVIAEGRGRGAGGSGRESRGGERARRIRGPAAMEEELDQSGREKTTDRASGC